MAKQADYFPAVREGKSDKVYSIVNYFAVPYYLCGQRLVQRAGHPRPYEKLFKNT